MVGSTQGKREHERDKEKRLTGKKTLRKRDGRTWKKIVDAREPEKKEEKKSRKLWSPFRSWPNGNRWQWDRWDRARTTTLYRTCNFRTCFIWLKREKRKKRLNEILWSNPRKSEYYYSSAVKWFGESAPKNDCWCGIEIESSLLLLMEWMDMSKSVSVSISFNFPPLKD